MYEAVHIDRLSRRQDLFQKQSVCNVVRELATRKGTAPLSTIAHIEAIHGEASEAMIQQKSKGQIVSFTDRF